MVPLTAALLLLAAATGCEHTSDAHEPPAMTKTDGARDFDFLMGRWRIHNRRLRERLKGSAEWDEFEATHVARPLLHGLGNEDEYRTSYWLDFIGMSFRFFNPATRQWAIYWADSRRGILDPPVLGSFSGDTGTFEGVDTFEGRRIRVRFIWSRVSTSTPRWEQAFSDDAGRTWETNWVMDFTRDAGCCAVLELRQYTLKPGRRDALIALFDRHFVESQEATGMKVMGQFRDRKRPDRFVWIRGFSDMASRHAALERFYGGPVWAEHKNAANDTMVDSDDVRLLKPATPDSMFRVSLSDRPVPGDERPGAIVLAGIHPLRQPAGPETASLFERQVIPLLRDNGVTVEAVYVTESAPNTFTRLPVRDGHVLVWFGTVAGRAMPAAGRLESALSNFGGDTPVLLELDPTARSLLGHHRTGR